jgi:H+/Cl- antiporter ClcA
MGASSMIASVTKSVSIAVIVLELDGDMTYIIPVLLSVLTSYITSELINPEGIYDILSDLNGLNDKIKEKGKIIVK